MPFKSSSQRAACYAKKEKGANGSWDCDEWNKYTNNKKLPEHIKKASYYDCAIPGFIKLAKKLFDPDRYPRIKEVEIEGRATQPSVQDTIVKRIQKAEASVKHQISGKAI